MRKVSTLFFMILLAGSAFAEPAAKFLPNVPNGECWRHWRRQEIDDTLFDLRGSENYPDFYRRLGREACWKQWLVIVYMAADNDLSPFSFRDLWEMESVGSTASVDVVVFQDNAQNDGMRYLHIARNGQPDPRFENLKSRDEELAFLESEGPSLVRSPDARPPMSEGDSGSLRVAGDFVRWAIKSYPSRRILLVGWSHAEGFDAPIPQTAITRELGTELVPVRKAGIGKKGGFALDLNPGPPGARATHMTVTEMASGMRGILKELRGGNPIDIAGSDACLNQQLEFGYEWVDTARYVFGSSTIVQKKGFNYHTLLGWLSTHPKFPTEDIAAEIPRIYGRGVSKAGADRKYSSYYDPFATMATWDTAKLIYLQRAMEDVAALLRNWTNEEPEPIFRLLELRDDVLGKAHRFGGISSDLYNLFQVLTEWADRKGLVALRRELRLADSRLTDAVVSSYIGAEYLRTGTSAAIPTSKGVAVWLPTTKQESLEMLPKFLQGKFYKSETTPHGPTLWASFVGSLYSME